MASPNATFTEMVTTTLRHRKKKFHDNVSNHNALYRRLMAKDKIEKLDGGRSIVVELEYAENGTYQRYSGYEELNIGASDVFTAAEFEWKQAAVNVTANGREIRENSGKNAMIKLVKSRIGNAQRTFGNNLSVDLYSDGTADGGLQIGGMQALITQAGTGTVGGINSSTYSWWRNQTNSATLTKSNIKQKMQELWLNCVRGTDRPDLLVSDNTLFQYYWDSLTDLQRYAKSDKADTIDDNSLMFNTAEVVHDSSDSGMPSTTMYFLNTDYLKACVHKDANLEVMDDKVSTNQDAVVIPILFQGNLVTSNRARQGILYNA